MAKKGDLVTWLAKTLGVSAEEAAKRLKAYREKLVEVPRG